MQEKNKQLRTTQQQSELLIGGRKLEQWSIIDRFEDVVENYADHCAVVSGDSRWTYTQLNEQSNQIARSLIANGVQSDEPVGIALPKSCELIAAVLGVLKAGGAYVPLVDNQPIARLHTMRADAGCRIIIGIDGYLDELYSDECVKIRVDSCAEFSRKNMESQRSHNQLAYILFTSGSTGTPKGVMIEDAGVIRLVCGQSYLPFSSDFNYLFAAPMSFDVSTLEIFTPLLHGAKLVVLPDGEPNAQVIRDVCHREKVQSTCMAFGLFSSLFESCPEIFEHMPVISVGGEQVNPEIIAQAQKRFSKTQFINAYGPTEATMLATTYAIPSDGRDTQTVLPIGKPLNQMFAYVLDEHLRIVPDGEEGELCLGGVGLARGYLNQDDHTSARFVNGPEGCEEKHRLYRTGDLVYKNHDGDFVFVDRIDTQVKIRGFRIELGEIEFAAMEIEEVKQAVAVVLGEGTNQGIGLAIKGDKENIQCDHIRSVLAEKLPEYMMPNIMQVVSKFPLNRNGKIDRQWVLSQLEHTERPANNTQPLMTPTELWLGNIVGDLLDVNTVYADDEFLRLGGHSLRAVVLCSRIRDRFQISMPMSAVYRCRTINEISKWIDTRIDAGVDDYAHSLQVVDSGGQSPLSFNQQRLWMLSKLNPDDVSYTITVCLDHDGVIDQHALEQAWETVCARHQVLRTRIAVTDEVPWQIVDDSLDLRIQLVECGNQSENTAQNRIAQESSRVFDIERGPLVRCTTLIQDQKSTIIVSMHHIISDAWSCQVVQRELSSLYRAYCSGIDAGLSDLPVQYSDFAHWQRGLTKTKEYAIDLAYWKNKLDGFEAVDLPLDYPRGAVPTGNGDRVSRVLDVALSNQIRTTADELGVTTYAYMLALFQTWIHRLTGSEDVVVGTPIANREWTEIEGLVGFFMETATMRTQIRCDDLLGDVICRVSKTTLDAFDHRDVPFQHIVDAVHAHGVRGRNPLFEVFFNQISMDFEGESDAGPLRFAEDQIDNRTAKFDLTCYVFQKGETIEVVFNYRDELLNKSTVDQFLDQYLKLVRGASSCLYTEVSQLEVLEESVCTNESILISENPVQIIESIPFEVMKSVEKYADHLALIWDEGELSYSQLWEKSGQIVSALAQQGIENGGRIVVSAEDPGDLAVSILGILRFGSMYIPLDPSWPDHRIAQVVKSVSPAHALVDQAMLVRLNHIGMNTGVICINEVRSSVKNGRFNDEEIQPSQPAYMLFTSGSTGEPKGVVQSHQGVVLHMRTFADSLSLTPDDRLLQLSSPAFDSAIMDMFAAWFSGATLCMYNIHEHGTSEIRRFISKNNVTVYHSAPSVYRLFTGSFDHSDQCPSIRAIVLGGEPVRHDDVAEMTSQFPSCTLFVNGMGLTESSLTLQLRVHPEELQQYTRSIPVGYPTNGSRVRLVDRDGRQTQLNGEIEVESNRIAMGYWDATSKMIMPMGEESEGNTTRRFRTGDQGMMQADGSIVHIGRLDRQVQVHGCRVEIDEVESVIKHIDGIVDAAVLAELTHQGDHELIGFIVVDQNRPINTQSIREHLSDRLPGYMIPTIWKRVEQIPRVGGGKIHRLALTDCKLLSFYSPDIDGSESNTDSLSDTTQLVIKVFQEVLEEHTVGADDCLFQLGGNSLKAIRIFSALKKSMGTKLSISVIYQASTPRQLAVAIDELASHTNLHADNVSPLVPLTPNVHEERVYLIPGIGGQPMGFMPMIERLDSNRHYVGLQLPSVKKLERIGNSIQSLATWFIDQMDLPQHDKSPDLIGYSFGGALAFEIALQLQARGFVAGKLILLDAHLPSGLPKKGKIGRLCTHTVNVVRGQYLGNESRIQYLQSKMFKAVNESTSTKQLMSSDQRELRSYKLNAKANRAMLGSYYPNAQYTGQVFLLQAIQPDWLSFHHNDGFNGWSSAVSSGMIQSKKTKAKHMDLFKPNGVREVSQFVQDWLSNGTD